MARPKRRPETAAQELAVPVPVGATSTGKDFGSRGWASAYRLFRAVFEGGVLLILLIAIETLFFGRGTYVTLGIHPFWLPVLLVTVQHGLYSGVITAVLASLMMDWPIRSAGEDIAAYYFQIALLPVQWLLAAMTIGLFRQAEIRAQDERALEIIRLRGVNERLAGEVSQLDADIWKFEMQAAIGAHRPGSPERGLPVRVGLARLVALRSAPEAELGSRFASAATALLGETPVRLLMPAPGGGFVEMAPGVRLSAGDAEPEIDQVYATLRTAEFGQIDGVNLRPVVVSGRTVAFVVAAPAATTDGPDQGCDEALRLLGEAVAAALSTNSTSPGVLSLVRARAS